MSEEYVCSDCGASFETNRKMRVHQSNLDHMERPWKNENDLYDLYVKQDMTTLEIADRWGCDSTTVSNWLSEFDIEKQKPWRDKDTLERLYYDESKSAYEIAEKFDIDNSVVYDWLDKHDLGSRTLSNAQRNRMSKNPARHYFNARGYEYVGTKVIDAVKEMPVHRLIAIAENGIDAVKDKVVHHKNGCPYDNRPSNLQIMSNSEHARIHIEDMQRNMPHNKSERPWTDEGLLKELYCHDEMTMGEVARELGCSIGTIFRWVHKFGLGTER